MNLENINYLAQTLGVFAILGSLVAIWYQQRQATRIARADMTERMLDKFHSVMLNMMTDSDLGLHYARLMRGQPPSDEAVEHRLVWFLNLLFQTHYSHFFLQRDRLADERPGAALEEYLLRHLEVPLFRQEWERTKKRRNFPPDFIDYIDDKLPAAKQPV